MKNLWMWIAAGVVGLIVVIGMLVKIGNWIEEKTRKQVDETYSSPYAFLSVESTGGYRTNKASPGFAGLIFPTREEIAVKPPGPQPTSVTRNILGVEARISIWGADPDVANDLADRAFNRMDDIAAAFDLAHEDSEIWQISRSAGKEPISASEHMIAVLNQALLVAQLSNGAYDPTDGTLVLLWRQALTEPRPFIPEESAIQAAREVMDYKSVKLNEEAGTVQLLKPDMVLDLTGVARAYLADWGVRYLDGEGVTAAVVQVGRSFATLGHKPDGSPFRILVDNPLMEEGDAVAILQLAGASVSSVGVYGEFVTVRSQRYSMIIDTRSGMSMANSLGVTVTGPDAVVCNALASAIFVMGPDQGRGLIMKMNKWYQDNPPKKR